MYKVFIHNKPLIFIDSDQQAHPEAVIFQYNGAKTQQSEIFQNCLIEPKNVPVCVRAEHPKQAFEDFFASFQHIEAAGGVVRLENHYLMMVRLGIPDLPKGKIDPGEDPHSAAVREIGEECGYWCRSEGQFLMATYHTYTYKGKDVLKKTWWYFFDEQDTPLKDAVLAPQTEEDISEVSWATIGEMKCLREETYPSLQEVFDRALAIR